MMLLVHILEVLIKYLPLVEMEVLPKERIKKLIDFKPVVSYIGPFELKAGQNKTHKIKLPNYVGAVRTMIVAGNNQTEAYGKYRKIG